MNDLKETIEQNAEKLFGGAKIIVQPYQDHISTCWDITIVPRIDGETRFIRVKQAEGLPVIMDYLRKIQANLLKLQHDTVIGVNVKPIEFDQDVIDRTIKEKLPEDKSTFSCVQCNFKTKYPGIFAIHNKKHKKAQNSSARAINDPDIYDVRE